MYKMPKIMKFFQLTAILVILGMVSPAMAGPEDPDSPHQAGHHDDEHEHHAHRNVFGTFFGITDENRGGRAFTFGLEYNRWVTDDFGIGVGIERAWGDLNFNLVTVPFAWRSGRWKFFAGPGLEKADDHDDSEFLVRAGVEYEFRHRAFEIAPKLMVDYVNDEYVFVVGVVIGHGF